MSAFSYLANQPAVFAIATMFLVASTIARAVDVEFYVIAKDEGFNQSSAAPPAPKGNPFRFNAIVGLSTPNSVTSASVRSLPGGQVEPLTAQLYSFELQAKFTTLSELDAAAPNGNYEMLVNAVHDGTHTITLPLNGDMYPSTPPHINNFAAAQSINPTAAFTLTWDPFSGGTANDFIQVAIADVSGVTLFQSPDPGKPGGLDGTATSLVIPANTLPPATTLGGQLLFARTVAADSTTYPGVTGFAAYYKFTQFNLTTTAATNFPPARLVTIAPSNLGQFQLQLIGQTGQQYVIEASTNLQLGPWTAVITNTTVGGQFNFADSQSVNVPIRFYRGRTAN